MSVFKKIFSKKEKSSDVTESATPKGFYVAIVKQVDKITAESVRIHFEIPSGMKKHLDFTPGQYIDVLVQVDGNELRRSYSICSGEGEDLAIGVKAVANGTVSAYLNKNIELGSELIISKPNGNFKHDAARKNVVAFAAGSGITPILSIAKSLAPDAKMNLFYGNRTPSSTMFSSDLANLPQVQTHYFYDEEQFENAGLGRIDKTQVSAIIKSNLELLKAEAFYICGPEEMILSVVEILNLFGVPKEKVHYELFTVPVKLKTETEVLENDFKGVSKLRVLLDDEEIELNLKSDGKTILDAVNAEGYDAPYSCRGGVCSTCKAKVTKGKVTMKLNFSLTDADVEAGYVLTCQAHPASEEVNLTYDV